jgi:ACS family D-galactonate transporter-like MFS transporter
VQRSIIAPAERVTNLRWGIAVLLGLGGFIGVMDRGALAVAAKPMQGELGFGPEQFGWLGAAFVAVYAIGQIPAGYLVDRYGVAAVSRVAALLWSVAAAMTALAGGFAIVAGSRLVLGVADATTIPAGTKAIAAWFPRAERSFATSLFDVGGKLSSALGIPFTTWLLVTFTWRGTFWAMSLLSLAFFVAFFTIYRNPAEDQRLTHAERTHIIAGGGEIEPGKASPTTRGAGFAYLLTRRKVCGSVVGFAAYSYFFGLLVVWLPAYLQTTFGVNVLAAAGYAFVVWSVAAIADIVFGGWLVDALVKSGRDPDVVRKTMLVGGLVLGLAVVGAAYAKEINLAVAFIAIAAAGLSAHAPVGYSIPGLIAPPNSTGRVSAIVNCLGSVAAFAAPAITGAVVARTGSFSAAFILAGVVLVAGVVAYTFVLGHIENIPEPT